MEDFTLVIFGITSNLAQIKLIPTLYDLMAGKELGDKFSVVGVGRTQMDRPQFETYISQTLRAKNRHHTHSIEGAIEQKLFSHLSYLSANLTDASSYTALKQLITSKGHQNLMIYLATFPSLYGSIFTQLKQAGLTAEKAGTWTRILIEKPIGTDRTSARAMNTLLSEYFREDQIFRLDHYLGKETIQNILTFRFGNGFLEPLMNSEHIDHIQVTAAEDFGIGLRGSYYDQNGAIKDVGQNHLLQMIALATMDKPSVYNDKEITRERVKVLSHLIPDESSLVIGQYAGYTNEKDVSPKSMIETYFSFKTMLDNDRFRGVPIYIRGGKCLARTATEISIIFKNSPNVLIYRIQPNEGIVLKIKTKKPGHTTQLEDSYMQYCYPIGVDLPDAYEKLIVDALRGDQTFFNDANEVDAQWAFTDPLVAAKHDLTPTIYEPGSWGPADGFDWLEPSIAFCTI
ncbi:MAG: glucose-6-phosphate dehydrogenase [bacterium]